MSLHEFVHRIRKVMADIDAGTYRPEPDVDMSTVEGREAAMRELEAVDPEGAALCRRIYASIEENEFNRSMAQPDAAGGEANG